MENSETSDGDDSLTSTVPPPMNENVESDSSQSEHGDSNSDEVTGDGAVNVNNPMQQPLSRGHQDYHVHATAAGPQFPANQSTVLQYHNFPRRMPLQLATAGRQVPANQNYGVQGYISPQGVPFPLAGQARVVSRGRRTAQALTNPTGPSQWRYPALVSPLFRHSFIPFDLMRGDFRQPQATAPVQPPIRFTSPPSTFVLAAARRSRLGLASDASFRPSSSRSANQSLPTGSSCAPQSRTDFSGLHALAQAAENFPTDHKRQGSVLAAARRSRLGLASDAPFRPSSSRSTIQSLPIGSSRTPKSQTDFPGLHALAQAAENIPTDHIKQGSVLAAARRSRLGPASYASFRPSSSRSANQSLSIGSSRMPQSQTDFSGLHAPAQAAENFPMDYIKQDFDKPPEPSGRNCFLCKRDLSFTPVADGPVSQPRVPPSVAVLPCGHYFHARCLEIVTPPEKSTDPPCMVCDLDENAS